MLIYNFDEIENGNETSAIYYLSLICIWAMYPWVVFTDKVQCSFNDGSWFSDFNTEITSAGHENVRHRIRHPINPGYNLQNYPLTTGICLSYLYSPTIAFHFSESDLCPYSLGRIWWSPVLHNAQFSLFCSFVYYFIRDRFHYCKCKNTNFTVEYLQWIRKWIRRLPRICQLRTCNKCQAKN